MRSLWNECRKILDVRLLILLFVITLLYYYLYMNILVFPFPGNSEAKYVTPMLRELIGEWGPTLPLSEWSKLEEKKEELEQEFGELLRNNDLLADAGVTSYDEMLETENALLEKEEKGTRLTDEEQRLMDEIIRLNFADDEMTSLRFRIQGLVYIESWRGIQYGVSEEAPGEVYGTDQFIQASRTRFTRDYVSLLHFYLIEVLQHDMVCLADLLLICFFVLIVPYQVRERVRGVLPLYASMRIGRGIFRKQLLASLLCCGFVGLVQIAGYVLFYVICGLTPFWACECWSYCMNRFWCDGLTFAAYMLVYLLLVLAASLPVAAVAYGIGRLSANYVAGAAIALPVGGALCWGALKVFGSLFTISETVARMPYWELVCILAWLLAVGTVTVLRQRRALRADLMA